MSTHSEKHAAFGLHPPPLPLWPIAKKYPTWSDLPANPTAEQVHEWVLKHQNYASEATRVNIGGAWWNPVTWWNAFSGTALHTFDDVKHWALTAARDVGNLLHEELHTVWSLSSGWFHDAEHWVSEGLRDAERGLHTAGEFVLHMFHRVWHDAAHWVDNARHEAAHLFDMGRHFAAHIGDNIRKWANETLRKNVWGRLDSLWHWFLHADTWAWRMIVRGAKDVYRNVIRPVEHAISSDAHRLWNIEKHLYGDVMMWIRVLEKAADWILWFAEHSFDDIKKVAEHGEQALFHSWLNEPKHD